MIDSPVLVLNQNYEPLNIARVRRAVVLVMRGKAEMLENGTGVIRTATEIIPAPSVICLAYLVKRPRQQKKLSRHEVFQRDRYTCQYCGTETKDLTLDHVFPRHRGGRQDWENVVSACRKCNSRKAGHTPCGVQPGISVNPVFPEKYVKEQSANARRRNERTGPGGIE